MESIEVLENELSVVDDDDDDGIGEELTVNHDLSHHHTESSLVTASDGASLVVDHDSTSDHGLEIEEGDTSNTVSGTECLSVIGSSGITTISQITSEQVIGLGLLLQNEKEDKNVHEEGNLEVQQMLQAVTFPDGTTAFIQHNKDLKLTEGQTLTLEDGTTAVVQSTVTTTKEVIPEANEENKIVEGQAIQLDDGTMAYLQTTKGPDGLQAITLEDGTTAYIAHPNPESLFVESAGLDGALPNMEHITQVTGNTDLTEESEIKQEIVDKGIIRMVDGDDQERNVPFGDKAFRCMYGNCGRLYTTLHHLKVHERSHTGDRPFKCDFIQCGKAFATGYGLKSHRRVHTGEKPYKCQENGCDKAFKTSGDLQKHVRTHTGERPFKCPFEGCTRSFTTSNIRKVHIRTHTGERPYNCTEEGCGRSFASATNYKNHVRIHTGEKPYVCTVTGCGKRFTEYSSLYKHHVVHTHSKPYECGHCGKTYRQTSTLAMHKRTAHGEEVTAVITDADTAQLFAQEGESDEPDSKRTRLQFINNDSTEDGEGMLVINTSQPSQQVGDLEGVRLIPEDESQTIQVSLPCLQQLQQQHTISGFTVNEQGQQVLVVTDPIQLEHLQASLQQIAGQIGTTGSLSITVAPTELTTSGTTSVTDSVINVDSVSVSNDSVSDVSESVTKQEDDAPTTTDSQSAEISIKGE